MLVLGAQFGFLGGAVCRTLGPYVDVQPEAFAVVGIAAFFTGVVRAPITGIVLATEMTGSVMLLPMLCARAMAMLAATLLKDPPILQSASRARVPGRQTHRDGRVKLLQFRQRTQSEQPREGNVDRSENRVALEPAI